MGNDKDKGMCANRGSAATRMARMALLVFAAAVSLASAVSCSRRAQGSANQGKSANDKGVFVIGLDDSFPPMGYRDENNEIVGFDVELAREVAKRMSMGFKAQPIDWDAKEMEIASGNIDCIWNGFTITDERKKQLLFSEPYLNNEQVILVTRSSGIRNDSDLVGKKVGVQTGSSGAESYEGSALRSKNSTVEFKDFLTALMDLRSGGIDALVIDSIVAGSLIKEYAGSDEIVIIRSSQLPMEQYGIGFRKSDVVLRDEVQRRINETIEDGTFKALADKYGILL